MLLPNFAPILLGLGLGNISLVILVLILFLNHFNTTLSLDPTDPPTLMYDINV